MPDLIADQVREILEVGQSTSDKQTTKAIDTFQAPNSALDEVLAKVKELESKCSARPSAIYDLDEHHRLKQPILIVLEEMDDSVLASWPELHLYAEGENPNSAIATLKREIIALYDDLTSSEADQLGEMPLRWRATLSHVIQENG